MGCIHWARTIDGSDALVNGLGSSLKGVVDASLPLSVGVRGGRTYSPIAEVVATDQLLNSVRDILDEPKRPDAQRIKRKCTIATKTLRGGGDIAL